MTEEEMAEEYAEGMAMYYESVHGSVPSQFEKYLKKAYLAGFKERRMMIEMHYPAKGDLPELSGEMRAERHCVLAYTESLGWTQAIRRRVGKRAFEWVCSNYDGNTLFRDDEIVAWTELPEPKREV